MPSLLGYIQLLFGTHLLLPKLKVRSVGWRGLNSLSSLSLSAAKWGFWGPQFSARGGDRAFRHLGCPTLSISHFVRQQRRNLTPLFLKAIIVTVILHRRRTQCLRNNDYTCKRVFFLSGSSIKKKYCSSAQHGIWTWDHHGDGAVFPLHSSIFKSISCYKMNRCY